MRICQCLIVCLLVHASAVLAAEPAAPTPEQLKFFEGQVRPLLLARCVKCHGPDKQKGDLRLDSRASTLAGGETGPAVEPGKPEESLLVEAINYESYEMPPDGQMDEADIATLTAWIKMGAPWPAGEDTPELVESGPKITDEDRQWWAYQPVEDPPVPTVDDGGWCRSDLDRFVYRRLQQEGLTPARVAGKQKLIRRLYFDLIGLPPKPEEVQAFLADESPHAYEALVDRLLDSPHYGEKWARHWLDLVRYAESDGYKADGYRPEAWRYRDYVIRSFNEDKPYDQFVREQLAGDEVAPGDADALTATMFLRHGMYEFNQRDVRGQWSLILNEITDTVGDVFLGAGMSCARCHDHKFDPILQKDYYRLQAFFTPLEWCEDAPLATLEKQQAYYEQLTRWREMTADIRRQLDEIERPILIKKAGGQGFDKFTPDLKEIILKRPEDRTPREQQIGELAMRQLDLDRSKLEKHLNGEQKERWQKLRQQLAQFDKHKPQPLPSRKFVVDDVGPVAPATFIPDKERLGEIHPGFLSVLDESPAEIPSPPTALQSTGRRTALANWIASEDNPLSTRVIVNRVWQYHFGTGLAANSSDFGHLGDPPSHPQLLDWLTSRFIDSGWRLKPLHRLIVTSATYRQAALVDAPSAMQKDPQNLLLWRQNIRRLDAEQIRDALLATTGELDLKMGGGSVSAGSGRRTVYTKVQRNSQDPLLHVFDAPDGLASTASRNTTTTAMQSLLLLNDKWPLERASKLASRLRREAPTDEERIRRAYWLCFGREASNEEVLGGLHFLSQQQAIIDGRAAEALAEAKDDADSVLATADFPQRDSAAAVLKPGSEQAKLVVPYNESLPGEDFTIEAFVLLESLYDDATVRTIAAHWDSNTRNPGWALGVTSKKSKYTPRNLILQLTGRTASGQLKYEVIPSDIHLELNQPYYVAASVKVGDTSEEGVTFYVKKLNDDSDLQTARAGHEVVRAYRPDYALNLGGRHGTSRHYWDGLLDEVRLSSSALSPEELLIQTSAAADGGAAATVGHWRFDGEAQAALADSSPRKNDISASNMSHTNRPPASTSALVDFCHVLLNANEFLYVD